MSTTITHLSHSTSPSILGPDTQMVCVVDPPAPIPIQPLQYETERIYSLWDLSPGGHIRNVKAVYSHHMLVVKVISKMRIRVMHYTAENSNKVAEIPESMQATGVFGLGVAFSSGSGSTVKAVAMVDEEEIELDPNSETVEIITYTAITSVYSADKAIERARTRIGEQAYHLFNNNCESFVNWALTDKAESKQGDCAKVALIGAGLAVSIGVGAALTVGVLRTLSEEKKCMIRVEPQH